MTYNLRVDGVHGQFAYAQRIRTWRVLVRGRWSATLLGGAELGRIAYTVGTCVRPSTQFSRSRHRHGYRIYMS